mgnify:CR=1 FL=1
MILEFVRKNCIDQQLNEEINIVYQNKISSIITRVAMYQEKV